MKKILAVLLILSVSFMLVSCGRKSGSGSYYSEPGECYDSNSGYSYDSDGGFSAMDSREEAKAGDSYDYAAQSVSALAMSCFHHTVP